MKDILDEPLEEDKPKKTKRTDAQKGRRHTTIGWIAFGISVLFALLTDDLMRLPRSLVNLVLILGFGCSLFNIIVGTVYKLKN